MSTFAIVSRRIVAAAACIGILVMGMATIAQAAPAEDDPGSAAAPPVPGLYQPLDASGGLLGIPRGAIPGIGTTEIHDTPGAEFIPGLEIVPLPKADAPAEPAADATDAEAAPAG